MRSFLFTFHLALFTLLVVAARAQPAAPAPTPAAPAPITIDASAVPPAPAALPFAIGGSNPAGHTFSANTRYLTLDGQPWFPVMGEFHYARYPASEWESEILKMKAGGITVISTYVFWIFHEETEGQFNWTGDRDLRAFIQLCAKHGLYVWIRIGPWDHGEVRNGGFPDWLLQEMDPKNTRTNDPAYLAHVTTFYNQIGLQTKGLFWKDGGPIIGVQIENEYHPGDGPGRGVEHINTLLGLAHAAGIDAPYYSETGWDNAAVPTTGFLPVFGGYTEQFWSASLTELPPNQNFFFDNIRAEDNVMGDLSPKNPRYNSKYADFPFLTAEMGGGMAIAYHRRPVLFGADSTAAALVKLGSGITGLGFYMYHGGTNPDGLTSMEETQSVWNGYNDMEAKSYDFQAPLGEFGQTRDSFRDIKTLALFLNTFGSTLAPMAPYFPDQKPKTRDDASTPRVALRSNGTSGFLFINNYQRTVPLDEHKNFQVSLKLADNSTVLVPVTPTTIPTGVYTIWPVNLDLNGVKLQYATAQLLTKIPGVTKDDPDTYVFFTWPGVAPEFSFTPDANNTIDFGQNPSPLGHKSDDPAVISLSILRPDISKTGSLLFTVKHPGSKPAQIFLLSRDDALNLYQSTLLGHDSLVLSPASLYFDGDQIHLASRDVANLTVGLYPPLTGNLGAAAKSAGFIDNGSLGYFQKICKDFASNIAPPHITVDFTQVQPAGASLLAKINPNPKRKVAMEPTDADFARAAVWTIKVDPAILTNPNRPTLEINYVGDVARLYAGNRFVDDNFYKGTPFEIGLWRLTPDELKNGLTLKILPLRPDTPLYLPPGARPVFPENADALDLKSINLRWDYQATLNLSP
jgi:hypothetical protein